MVTLIINVEVSSDGTYLLLKDLTPSQEFIDNGIDINSDIVSVTYTLTDSDSNDYVLDVSGDYLSYIRSSSGFSISVDNLSYGSTYFADGIYTSTLDVEEDSTGVNNVISGDSDNIFLTQILQIMVSQIKDADWKELYNPHNQQPNSDLRKRLMYMNIIYSSEAGLTDEAERIRLALNKLCSYDG